MKKVFGILMIVVMMAMMLGTALANEIVYSEDGDYACELVREFVDCQGYDDHSCHRVLGSILYGYGVVHKEEFEEMSGMEWSVENFEKYCKEDWEVCEVHTKCIGEIEGYNVYLSEQQSVTKVLGTQNGENYYCISVVFMVYSNNEMYEH